MAVVKDLLDEIASPMKRAGFSVHLRRNGPYFVRESEREGLFEWIQLDVAGRRNEVIVPMMAVAVVHLIETQYQGLRLSGGLEELHSEEEGRVRFGSRDEWHRWGERLVAIAPERAREFAARCGDRLLAETQIERDAALRVYEEVIRPFLSIEPRGSLERAVKEEQRSGLRSLLERPMVVGSEELRTEYEMAVAAFLIAKDADISRLAENVATPPRDAVERLAHLRSIPRQVMWKIRLLVDLLVRRQEAHVSP